MTGPQNCPRRTRGSGRQAAAQGGRDDGTADQTYDFAVQGETLAVTVASYLFPKERKSGLAWKSASRSPPLLGKSSGPLDGAFQSRGRLGEDWTKELAKMKKWLT